MATEMRKPLPHCKAFLLCERVITEENTGYITIVSSLNDIMVPCFPAETQPLLAFLQMTQGIGEYDLLVEIHDLTTNEIIGRSNPFRLGWPTRFARMTLTARIPPLTFMHAGLYDFVVLLDRQEIQRQQVEVSIHG